ncbi:MAG: hypothetical protein ACI4RI_06485 [Ruminococcus sp.]
MPAKKDTKSLATVDVSKFTIQSVDMTTTSDEIAEELDGLGTIPFDRVKWPTGGNTTFEVPDEEDDSQYITTDKITGVIAYHHPMNSRWEGNYNGNNEPPVCYAMDGKKGINTQTGEIIDCATCPYNQFESNGSTSGKACKNIHRLYIIQNDNPVPLLVALPPTSLNSFRNYLGKKLLIRGKKSADVITEISLKKENSKNNMAFAKAVFKKVGDLTPTQIENAKSLSAMIKSIAKTEVIATSEDYNMSSDSSDSVTQNNEVPLPPIESHPATVVQEAPPAPANVPPTQKVPEQDPFAFIDDSNPFE